MKAMGKVEQEVIGLDDKERLVLDSGEAMIIEESINQRTYLTTKAPLRDEQRRVIGLIGVATDITERKRGQQELEKLVVAEQRLRAEAERANRAKDEFLAIVSHELRSPLNALRGWSHLLATTRPLEPTLVERAAKAIKRNVDHQTRLIDDLLDTSRIVSGKLNIERRVVNLAEMVNAALEAARPGAAGKEITLRFTPGDAVMVVGDSGRLQQLASNLLSNAVKFTPERGAVQVSLLKNGERVQLVVRDNGLGIAPEFLPHVFDRFTQADTTSARRAGGLGIGLALVRHIALLHGGQVRADSPGLGKGATFTVDLPAAPLAAALAAIGAPSPDQRRRVLENALAEVRVWIADDDPDAHEVVALTLQQAGAVVRSFGSGRQLVAALEVVLASEPPDLLLLDLAMPDQDGIETLRRARSLELSAGIEHPIPAIALTAFTQVERERLRAAGFTDRVDKPVDADKLVAAIRVALKDRQAAKTGTQ
jgi:signal transduction histidine kinase/CheY-like chemotaxis protein